MKEYIRAIAEVDLHDLLTPIAICWSIESSARHWTDEDTKRYGTEIRDRIFEMAEEIRKLG